MLTYLKLLFAMPEYNFDLYLTREGCLGRDHMLVGFTSTYVISHYHQYR